MQCLKMRFSLLDFLLLFQLCWVLTSEGSDNISFYKNYDVTWGFDHVFSLNQGRDIQLSLDISSGYSLPSCFLISPFHFKRSKDYISPSIYDILLLLFHSSIYYYIFIP